MGMIQRKTDLVAADILPVAEFESRRKEFQAELRNHKQHRRLDVGPFCSVYFESWFTMWWQVQEMLRVERGGDEQLADELAAYAPMVPKGRNLSATMMIEIEDPVRRHRELARLGGIEDQVFLVIDGMDARAEAADDLERTNDAGKTSSVHFFHFPLTEAQAAALKSGTATVMFAIRHPNYNHLAGLAAEQVASLAADLA